MCLSRMCLSAGAPLSQRSEHLIMDRRSPNGDEAYLAHASPWLAPGWVLSDLLLHPGERLLIWSTDLQEMCYSFDVSDACGATTCVALPCALSAFEGTHAELLFRHTHPGARRDWRVLPALHTEAMGDINTVDFAQEAHANVLSAHGAWRCGHRIKGLDPLPHSSHAAALDRPRPAPTQPPA